MSRLPQKRFGDSIDIATTPNCYEGELFGAENLFRHGTKRSALLPPTFNRSNRRKVRCSETVSSRRYGYSLMRTPRADLMPEEYLSEAIGRIGALSNRGSKVPNELVYPKWNHKLFAIFTAILMSLTKIRKHLRYNISKNNLFNI